MSDQARQSFTDKAAASLKPDTEKSTPEKIGDKIKGAVDSVASEVQPKSQKSTGQEISDTISSEGSDDTSLVNKAKDAAGIKDRGTN